MKRAGRSIVKSTGDIRKQKRGGDVDHRRAFCVRLLAGRENMRYNEIKILCKRKAGERSNKGRYAIRSGGSYVLEKPVVLNTEDSGLVIEGGGASVRCGCVLTNWADDADGLLAARVPEGADPAMLLIGGRARPRARYPETGALTYRSTTDVKWMNSTNGGWNRPLTHEELTRVVVNPADFPKNMDVRNAEITVFHEWDESTVRVRSLDRKTGLVELESELEHPAGSLESANTSSGTSARA